MADVVVKDHPEIGAAITGGTAGIGLAAIKMFTETVASPPPDRRLLRW
jgi:hypothetical protein